MARVIVRPTVAEEDCTIMVTSAPIATHRKIPPKLSVENLVKNAIDAMKGRGKLTVEISQLEDNIKVSVSDTGMGIHKKQFKKIFEPGYTTKKRGWGLGLSLVKRIIEEYHKGKIKVLSSSKEGTIMQISLKSDKK